MSLKTWVVVAVLAMATLCGPLAACGGDDGAPMKYTDATYGFTITLPAGYARDDKASSTKRGDFLLVWAQKNAPRPGGESVNTIVVGVREEGYAMSSAQIAAQIAAMRGDTPQLEESLGSNALVEHSEEATIAGASALIVDATMDGPDDSLVTSRIAYIFAGSQTYIVWLSALDRSWKDNEADLQGALVSFTTD